MHYILVGEGEFVVGDVSKEVGPGDLVYVPAGTVHRHCFPHGGVRLIIYTAPFDSDNPTGKEATPTV